MAHELDTTKGRAAIAYRGAVPWHGLGETILPEDDIHTIRLKAGLDYDVIKTPVQYEWDKNTPPGVGGILLPNGLRNRQSRDRCVLYRSDTGDDLSVVSNKYQVVQPSQVIEFYRDLVDKHGFQLEVVGALKGGRKVWALANTTNCMTLPGEDRVKGFLLLATSYDGTMATQARFTAIRVVCNNTLTLANSEGRPDVSVPHSAAFNAEQVKVDLKIGDAWVQFRDTAQVMAQQGIKQDDFARLLLASYYGLTSDKDIIAFQGEEKNNQSFDKLVKRMTTALHASPGAHMASARGMLWGALNAVTFDVDHQLPSRSVDTRLDKAWFGAGDAIKRRAYDFASILAVR